jgi:tight adherence protein B
MNAFVLALGFGLGIFLAYEGLTDPRPLDPAGWLAARRAWLARPIAEFLAGAGLPDVAPRDFALASGATGLVGAAAAQLTLGWPLVALAGFLLGLALPFGYYARRRDERRARLRAELADAIDQLAAAVRAGLSLGEALAALAAHGPPGMRPEWAALARDQRLGGLSPALDAFRARLADSVVDTIALAMMLAEETGGRNLTAALDRLAVAVRGRVQLLAAARAEQARHRLTAQVIAALPLALLLLVHAISPDYLAVYDTWGGQVAIGVAALMVGLGYALMLAVARLPDDPRVLE